MKKEMIVALAVFFFMSVTALTGVYVEAENNKIKTISIDKKDVTGDGIKDTITIKGSPYEEGSEYLNDIFMEVDASNGKTYKAKLDPGFDPTIQYVDLNHDGLKDMYIRIPTGGSGGLSNFYLYTLKDFQLTDLTIPDPLVIDSQFQNGYKAKMTIKETGKTYTFDLRNRAAEYERIGLYHNGMLNEPTELMVDPYSTLKPIKMKDNQYGLLGMQSISGAYHADSLAIVQSKWVLEKDKWVLINAKIMKLGEKK